MQVGHRQRLFRGPIKRAGFIGVKGLAAKKKAG
jgi:hypothetical protein